MESLHMISDQQLWSSWMASHLQVSERFFSSRTFDIPWIFPMNSDHFCWDTKRNNDDFPGDDHPSQVCISILHPPGTDRFNDQVGWVFIVGLLGLLGHLASLGDTGHNWLMSQCHDMLWFSDFGWSNQLWNLTEPELGSGHAGVGRETIVWECLGCVLLRNWTCWKCWRCQQIPFLWLKQMW